MTNNTFVLHPPFSLFTFLLIKLYSRSVFCVTRTNNENLTRIKQTTLQNFINYASTCKTFFYLVRTHTDGSYDSDTAHTHVQIIDIEK